MPGIAYRADVVADVTRQIEGATSIVAAERYDVEKIVDVLLAISNPEREITHPFEVTYPGLSRDAFLDVIERFERPRVSPTSTPHPSTVPTP